MPWLTAEMKRQPPDGKKFAGPLTRSLALAEDRTITIQPCRCDSQQRGRQGGLASLELERSWVISLSHIKAGFDPAKQLLV